MCKSESRNGRAERQQPVRDNFEYLFTCTYMSVKVSQITQRYKEYKREQKAEEFKELRSELGSGSEKFPESALGS